MSGSCTFAAGDEEGRRPAAPRRRIRGSALVGEKTGRFGGGEPRGTFEEGEPRGTTGSILQLGIFSLRQRARTNQKRGYRGMKRHVLIALTVLVAVGMTATAALASSPHFKKGGEPKCTISGTATSKTVVCTGTLAGLGGEDLRITTTVSGFALYECQNNGGNTAPGQNRVLEGPSTVPTDIDSSAIKNGNLTFTTNPNILSASPTVSGAAAGCPSAQWTGVNPTLTITSITLVIEQPVGTAIFTCTASNPNGLTSPVTPTC